jgi:hypothetical protein
LTWNRLAVRFSSSGSRGQSASSDTLTLVTMFVAVPHIMCNFTHR